MQYHTRLMGSRLSVLFALALGTMAGLGAYTFQFARGLAYLSNDPAACANCHIMNDHLDSWLTSSHHTRATCNDCHTPHSFFGKWITKADNGWNHSVRFTLQDFAQPIRIRGINLVKVEQNCQRCHSELTNEIRHAGPMTCTHCHAGVGHGPRR
jgi:cytochrome c nitrite reductase small subunit